MSFQLPKDEDESDYDNYDNDDFEQIGSNPSSAHPKPIQVKNETINDPPVTAAVVYSNSSND